MDERTKRSERATGASILVDVKGMSEETISGIQTAAYGIQQEVFTAAVPQLV